MIKQLRFDLRLLRKKRIQFIFCSMISIAYIVSAFYWRYIKEEVIAMAAVYQSMIVCALICDALNHHLYKEHSVLNYKSLVYFPTTRERYYASKGIIVLGLCIFESVLTWINVFIARVVLGDTISAEYGWSLCYLIIITLLIESLLYFGATLNAWILQNVVIAIIGLCAMAFSIVLMNSEFPYHLLVSMRWGIILSISFGVWLISLYLITLISKKLK